MELLVVCTGNAARSVMAGLMLEHRAEEAGVPLWAGTAGTHALAGQPASWRTRQAVASVPALAGGAGTTAVTRHRSRQLEADQLAAADLVVAMEGDHVRFVRRVYPEAAGRTATLRRLCRDLPPGPPETLADRLAALDLAAGEPEPWEDVADPAGGDLEAYVTCAAELWTLTGQLLSVLFDPGGAPTPPSSGA